MKRYEIQQAGKGIDGLALVERPDPRPGPGQILVRMRAASLNYRDLLMVEERREGFPLVPLSDGAGEVVAVGEGVTRFEPGDRVVNTFFADWVDGELTPEKTRTALGGAVDGVLSERVVLSQEGVVQLPRGLSLEEGATLPCAALTAWHALRPLGNLQPGQSVLLQGTGGVSIFGLQFAKAMGARVIITSSSDEKLERARSLGADELINYRRNPDWEERVLELTGGQGVDHVLEVGGAGTSPRSVKATRPGGRITFIGRLTGTHGKADPALVGPKDLRAQGIYVGSRRMFEEMNAFIVEHGLKPVIDRVFPFAEVREAFRELKRGGHFGKLVVTI